TLPAMIAAAKTDTARITSLRSSNDMDCRFHKTTTGVTSSAAARLPKHQVVQFEESGDESAYPPTIKALTPIVAPTMVVPAAMRPNLTTFSGVSNALQPPDHWLTRSAARRVSRVLATATAAAG